MEPPIVQEIRDGFDELFLGTKNEVSEKSKALFTALGIEGFAEICVRSKKYGYNASTKILQDLVKLSFVVYSNLDALPLQKKIILPEESGSYKFIVTSLPHSFLRDTTDSEFKEEASNVLFLVSTKDANHADIAKKMGLRGKYAGEWNILGGARIDIDHEKKTLNIHDDSGSYESCSNQFVQWMLEEHEKQGYTILINMKGQKEFFSDTLQ